MKTTFIIILLAVASLTLSEAIQFGLFNFNPPQTRTSTTIRPKSQFNINFGFHQPSKEFQSTPKPLLNILQPVTSLLNAVGKTVESILNLLVGGLRYRPYKRITTIAPPVIIINTTPYPYEKTSVFKVIIEIPKNLTKPTSDSTDTAFTHESPEDVTPLSSPAITTPTKDYAAEVTPPTPSITPTNDNTSDFKTQTASSISPATIPTITTPKKEEVILPESSTISSTTTTEAITESTTTTQASITEKGKPENVDWRRLNCSAPVRFQGQCRASFAFAVAASIETQLCFKTGTLAPLSAQNLIDCTIAAPFENAGCDGGALEPTYDYIVNVGINLDVDYPYTASVAKCKFMQDKSIGKIKDYMSIDEGDEDTMEYVLNNVGPIAVGIDASQKSFVDYKEGIYYEPKCKSDIESLTHAVLLVGYGVEPDGRRYWLIRNSYGTSWGDKGYGKIARDPSNHCGISTYAVYPIVN